MTFVAVLVVAGCTFWAAFDNGTYAESSRAAAGVAVWWTILLVVATGVVRLDLTAGGWLAVAGFAGLAGVSLASAWWAPSAERAVGDFDRVALLGGVFVLSALAAQFVPRERWADGLLIGIAAVTVLALTSRLFSAWFAQNTLLASSSGRRLSYPLGYWNGLAIFSALAVPLALRVAATGRQPLVRGLAAAVIPLVATVAYFASSRGGFAVAAAGAIALFAFCDRRWDVALAGVIAGAGAVVAVAAMHEWRALVVFPVDRAASIREGHEAAAALVAICLVVALATAVVTSLVAPRLRERRRLGIVLAAVAVVGGAIVLAAEHPVRQYEAFKRLPGGTAGGNLIETHLLSSSGSGRWQFWAAAVDEFRAHPLKGGGAGSYESWWAKHGSISAFVRDAHSLYLQTAAELGVLGLLCLFCVLAGGAWSASRALRSQEEDRTTAAALAATGLAFALAAAFDWVWELSAVAFVGLAAIGALAGRPGVLARASVRLRLVGALVAAVLIAPQLLVFLADARLQDSRHAAAAGDAAAATSAALDARRLEPWGSSPPLQLALVAEQEQRLAEARGWIDQAIARDRHDWRLWLIAARLETKAGDVAAARRSLARARELNPRSPFFRLA